jgi:hypothetical protein
MASFRISNKAIFIVGAFLAAPLAQARDCAPAPVRNSEQALCYAAAYAEKNALPYKGNVTRRVSKGAKAWTVRVSTKKPDGSRGPGWEMDVDIATATSTRFKSYR